MIYAPLLSDEVAVRFRLAPVGPVQGLRREALLLLRELNELKASDIVVQCAFIGDQIALAGMRRWQPDLRVQPISDFSRDASEAIEYLRRTKGEEAA